MTARHSRRRDDAGFTMLELATTMMIFGVLSAIAVGGLYSMRNAFAEQGAQREVLAGLRLWQTRAVAEETTYCVDFGSTVKSTSYTVYKVPGADAGALPAGYSCSASGTKVAGPNKAPDRTAFKNVTFAQRNGTDTAFVLFYPRGASSSGTFTVVRDGSTKTYTVTVEGLTARVSSSGS